METVTRMTKKDIEILENLKTFRDLSANQKAHPALLKVTALLYDINIILLYSISGKENYFIRRNVIGKRQC